MSEPVRRKARTGANSRAKEAKWSVYGKPSLGYMLTTEDTDDE